MNVKDALDQLERLGTAQNRKVYARHGVTGEAFGVSYANLGKLVKKWKGEHDLAVQLWASGNHDARVLAAMIVDGERLTGAELDAWLADCDYDVVVHAVSGAAARSPHAVAKSKKWTAAKGEWPSTAGWNLIGILAARTAEIGDADLAPRIAEIEARIHSAANRTRYAMNLALIAIGGYRPGLRAAAIAAAKRIGPVAVDHGETGCKTPDAVLYIARMVARQAGKTAKPAATSKGRSGKSERK